MEIKITTPELGGTLNEIENIGKVMELPKIDNAKESLQKKVNGLEGIMDMLIAYRMMRDMVEEFQQLINKDIGESKQAAAAILNKDIQLAKSRFTNWTIKR